MKLTKDSKGYMLQVNNDAARKHLLTDIYPSAGKKDGVDAVNHTEILTHYKDRLRQFEFIWNNSGMDVDGVQWNLQDMYSVPDAPILMPRVITSSVRESIEPILIATSLLQRINYTMGQTIMLPSYGALSMAGLDIPEGGEYPEAKMSQTGSGTMIANIGKSGIAVKISDEMIRYSQFDVIGMHLKAAGRCMARHKEVKALNMISHMGTTYFDNKNPTASIMGTTRGRGPNFAQNGSVTTDDLFDLWGQIMAKGFNGDTMMLHPLCYTMFFNANTNVLYGGYRGSPMGGNPWATSNGLSIGKTEQIYPDTPAMFRDPEANTAPVLPSYLPYSMSIILSPFMRYDVINKTTDILIFERGELGVILVDEELTTEEWMDPARDIRKIKMRERYALGILNEGQAVAIIRNAVNVDNYMTSQPAIPNVDVTPTGGVPAYAQRAPVAGL